MVVTALIISNQSAIPIQIITQSNWSQYIISLAIGSAMLLWVFGNMFASSIRDVFIRIKLKSFSKLIGKPVLFINHSQDYFLGSDMITRQMIQRLNAALNKFKGESFALILNTPGGDVFATMLASNILKNYPSKIDVYVPNYAMSGGTLLALSCASIHMNRYSALGCVDPQIGGLLSYGSAAAWKDVIKKKGKEAHDNSFIFKRLGEQVEKSIKNHIMMLINNRCSSPKAFAELLTSGKLEHIYQINSDIMKQHGFNIIDITPEEQKRLDNILKKNSTANVIYT